MPALTFVLQDGQEPAIDSAAGGYKPRVCTGKRRPFRSWEAGHAELELGPLLPNNDELQAHMMPLLAPKLVM